MIYNATEKKIAIEQSRSVSHTNSSEEDDEIEGQKEGDQDELSARSDEPIKILIR